MSKTAIILAGGEGTRLKPYTNILPKPLMPIFDKPILEIILGQLSFYGFNKIHIMCNKKNNLIESYFGTGSKYNVDIIYHYEKQKLSTMSPLRNIENLPDDFIVMNGDILTDLNFNLFFLNHLKSKKIFSISSKYISSNIDYGVITINKNNNLIKFEEKPKTRSLVSMGIYCINIKSLKYIPKNSFFGFDNLMKLFLKKKIRPNINIFEGIWLDIGRESDLLLSNDVLFKNKEKLIKSN